jgi:hypothetical protein
MSVTLGGMLYVEEGLTLTVLSSNISNIEARSGAALYVSGVVSIINSSSFVNLDVVNGSGGAIFFGANSGFSLYGVYFVIIKSYFFFFYMDNNVNNVF